MAVGWLGIWGASCLPDTKAFRHTSKALILAELGDGVPFICAIGGHSINPVRHLDVIMFHAPSRIIGDNSLRASSRPILSVNDA